MRAEKKVFDHSDYEWKRVSELVDTPQFISNGTTRFDVNQGGIQSYTHQVINKANPFTKSVSKSISNFVMPINNIF
jgi:hypothetical protein